ncbi:MAG: hypothetical protein ACJA12_000874 [Glaciecola sp.]|jgi:hypothetical protein
MRIAYSATMLLFGIIITKKELPPNRLPYFYS